VAVVCLFSPQSVSQLVLRGLTTTSNWQCTLCWCENFEIHTSQVKGRGSRKKSTTFGLMCSFPLMNPHWATLRESVTFKQKVNVQCEHKLTNE